MTKFLVCLVTAFWCLSASAQSGQMKSMTVESEIAALEQSWAAAQKANDPSTIATLLADNYIEVLPDGSLMNKSQVLADTNKSKYQTIELSDLRSSASAIPPSSWARSMRSIPTRTESLCWITNAS